MTGGFGFHSPLSRENATPALNYLAGYVGQDAVEQLATCVVWAGEKQAEKPWSQSCGASTIHLIASCSKSKSAPAAENTFPTS